VEYSAGLLSPNSVNRFSPSSLRWILYDMFLAVHHGVLAGNYAKIMFADAEDTAFQADVFSQLPGAHNYVFQEGGVLGTPISASVSVSKFITDCFGDKILSAVRNNAVVTSGVSLFSYEKGVAYVKLMTSILIGKSVLSQKFPACEEAGVDNAVHNIVVHLGLLAHVDVKSEAEFSLANIGSSEVWNNPGMQLENLQTHNYDRVSNKIRIEPLAVIHQYPRVPSLFQELSKVYVYWKKDNSAAQMWQAEEQCQKYGSLLGSDVYMGYCDGEHKSASTVDECCRLCSHPDTEQRCYGFYFASGFCHFRYCDRTNAPPQVMAAMSAAGEIGEPWYEDTALRGNLSSVTVSAFL
jgi:hypothetical protein